MPDRRRPPPAGLAMMAQDWADQAVLGEAGEWTAPIEPAAVIHCPPIRIPPPDWDLEQAEALERAEQGDRPDR